MRSGTQEARFGAPDGPYDPSLSPSALSRRTLFDFLGSTLRPSTNRERSPGLGGARTQPTETSRDRREQRSRHSHIGLLERHGLGVANAWFGI